MPSKPDPQNDGGPSAAPPTGAGAFDAWFSPLKMALLVLALLVVAFPDVFFQNRVFYYRDAGIFNYPLAFYQRDSLWSGEWPLWNPYCNCGVPFLAQWNTMSLYPPSLLYVLLPPPWSVTFFSFGHLILGALGMYFLARRWTDNRLAATFAGLVFAWNGITLHSQMWPNSCAAIGWMPWVILLMERVWKEGSGPVLPAALAAAMQLLAGVPEIILLTWTAAGGLFLAALWEQPGKRAGMSLRTLAAGALAAGLTAAQMLPFLDLLRHSHRGADYAGDQWAMPLWGWANFVVPLFRTSPDELRVFTQDEQQWTSSYYLGAATLVFAWLGIRREGRARVWILAGLTAAACVFSFGKAGIVYPWVQKVIPVFGFMRYPAKWTQLAMLCLPLLAAFGLARLQSRTQEDNAAMRRRLWAAGAAVFLCMAAIAAAAYFAPRPDEPYPVVWKNALMRAVFLAAMLAVAANFSARRPVFSRKTSGLLLLALAGLDIAFHVPRQVHTIQAQAYQPVPLRMESAPKPGIHRAMQSSDLKARMRRGGANVIEADYLFKRLALFMNCNLLERVPKVDGLFSLYPKESAEVLDRIYFKHRFSEPLADFLGASQILHFQESLDWIWTPRPTAMPMVTAGQKPVFADAEAGLEGIFSAQFEPRKTVYLPKEAETAVQAREFVPDVKINDYRFQAHRISLRVETPQPCLVVAAQTWYHPWEASVDGRPTPVWKANHAFQAVEVPAGEHVVEWVYRDRAFRLGGMISLVSLGLCIAWGAARIIRFFRLSKTGGTP